MEDGGYGLERHIPIRGHQPTELEKTITTLTRLVGHKKNAEFQLEKVNNSINETLNSIQDETTKTAVMCIMETLEKTIRPSVNDPTQPATREAELREWGNVMETNEAKEKLR